MRINLRTLAHMHTQTHAHTRLVERRVSMLVIAEGHHALRCIHGLVRRGQRTSYTRHGSDTRRLVWTLSLSLSLSLSRQHSSCKGGGGDAHMHACTNTADQIGGERSDHRGARAQQWVGRSARTAMLGTRVGSWRWCSHTQMGPMTPLAIGQHQTNTHGGCQG